MEKKEKVVSLDLLAKTQFTSLNSLGEFWVTLEGGGC